MACSSTQRRRVFAERRLHVLAMAPASERTFLESADNDLFKMIRHVFLRPLRPERRLPAKTLLRRIDEQAIRAYVYAVKISPNGEMCGIVAEK
jgi:hypothetical protein